jgi:catecholate siderophore receptor
LKEAVVAYSRLLLIPLLLCSTLLSSQELINISGTVTDKTQAVVPGATVELQYDTGQLVKETVSDGLGNFVISDVPSGEYTLLVTIKGFTTQKQRITVSDGKSISAQVELAASGNSEVITVTAEGSYSEHQAVTATKMNIPLRDVPQSIQVVNSDLLRAQAVTSMQDAVRNVAGVGVQLGEGRRDQVLIRGFSAQTDFYVNGVRDDAPYYRDISTLDRVEVLKGPAAVLYGRGSSGGIINRVTRTAELEQPLMAELTTMFGSYGEKRTSADLGTSFFGGKLSARLPGAWEDTGSHRHYYDLNRYTFAPSLLWNPETHTQVAVQMDYLRDNRLPDRGIPSVNGLPADVEIGTYYGYNPDDYLSNKAFSQGLNVQHQAGRLLLRDVFRHTNYNASFSNTFSNGTAVSNGATLVKRGQYNSYGGQDNYFNQAEAVGTLHWLGMTHSVLGGVEYGFQSRGSVRFDGTAADVALIDPVLTRPNYGTVPRTNNVFDATTTGIYVQDQINIAAKWKATAGVRFDYYKQDLNDRSPVNNDLERVDHAWSPRVGLVYQPISNVSVYGSYSHSFQPSGDGLSLATNNAELKPETTENYEAGVKFETLQGKLSTTVSAFHLIRNNIKTTDPVDPTKLVLAGEQRTNGVEVSFDGRITRHLDLYGGYAWLDARVLKSNSLSSGVPIEGRRPGLVPLHSGSIWATYQFENGFGFGSGVIYNADRFVASDDLVVLPGFTRVDATVFYRQRHYDVALNLRNVGNVRYYDTAQGNFQIYPGSPISGVITTRLRW